MNSGNKSGECAEPSKKKIKVDYVGVRPDVHPIERVCSACKVSKIAMDNFSQTQRRKRGSATCNECVMRAIEEKNAEVVAQRHAEEKRKLEQIAEDKMMEILEERPCSMCNVIKERDNFDRGQQRMGKRSRCRECVEKMRTVGRETHKLKKAAKQKEIQECVSNDNVISASTVTTGEN